MPTAEAAITFPELSEVLQDAKFSAPQPRRGSVSRGQLIETAWSSGRRCVAVTAPAGYGKSTFLAEWAAAEERPVAWVSLDRFDDDPAMLLVSVASAYRRAGLDGADLVADMGARDLSALGRAAPRLAAAFRASPVPFVLMLDDLHELRSPACHDVLSVVIAAVPPGSQFAAASRCEQPHLPRLRVSGDALEFGPGDLALDADGARQIFSNAQLSLPPEGAAALAERTEGWPVGLFLAALIAKESHCPAGTVTGDDRYVADYLYREALIRQPKAVQRFLRRTAVLDQLCAPLCEAVLDSPAAAVHLRHIAAQSLFLTPLDRRREWYRYHGLFREFLLAELRRTEPGLVMTLHQRAADWYETHGSPALAVDHLLHTTVWDRTLPLVTKLTLSTYMTGQLSTVRRWLRAIGDANIERYPPLAVYRCYECVLTGDTREASRWAALVDAATFDEESPDGMACLNSARATLRAAMCADGPASMLADAEFAVAQERQCSPLRDTALFLLAEAHLLTGQVDQARAYFREASAAAVPVGSFQRIVAAESELASLAMDRGDWPEAAGRLDLALATIEEKRLHDYVYSSAAFAGAARLAVHRGDLSETHRRLAQAMRVRPRATYLVPYHAVRLRLQLGKVYLALADPATSHQLVREINDVLTRRPALGTLADEVADFRGVLSSSTTPGAPGTLPLTPAELRLLPYLQTHLTADKIADRLFVSSHTVKTQVKSIYRKLGVSSRNDAVQKAAAIGLLGA